MIKTKRTKIRKKNLNSPFVYTVLGAYYVTRVAILPNRTRLNIILYITWHGK